MTMRARHVLPLLLLAGCGATPREPGLAGYLHIFEAARDARLACAGLPAGCAPPSIRDSLERAEAEAPRRLFLPRPEAREDRVLARTALEAAEADCRVRGVRPGSARWDSCLLDRGIIRLEEAAAERGRVPETTKGALRRPSGPTA
ncbi:hypothetical protein [Roseomonas populi]|uniref:Lipoprotein n=1 Tax=Roseomonas populi TaxID=3121582 RepID=A0ABT1WY31_9PROT|nr:hypothetical protein [Roseomonas pecuniae]MCR0980756.1 hypothetical protein [Roseomonas pecuniae]